MPIHEIGLHTQRELVPILKDRIDAASSKQSTAHRDIARHELRHLLQTENWRTSFVLNNLGSRRCKFIASFGFWVTSKWLLTDWKSRPGVDKPEIEE